MIQAQLETEHGLATVLGEMVELWGHNTLVPQKFGILVSSGLPVTLTWDEIARAQQLLTTTYHEEIIN